MRAGRRRDSPLWPTVRVGRLEAEGYAASNVHSTASTLEAPVTVWSADAVADVCTSGETGQDVKALVCRLEHSRLFLSLHLCAAVVFIHLITPANPPRRCGCGGSRGGVHARCGCGRRCGYLGSRPKATRRLMQIHQTLILEAHETVWSADAAEALPSEEGATGEVLRTFT